ncbi:MAG: hypothetical protein QF466_02005 [Desulfobacterales bacterium]|nr:hypothetical protein [Desulfobacterales bacterium]
MAIHLGWSFSDDWLRIMFDSVSVEDLQICFKFDNNVSRIMANVVNAFSKDGKLPGLQYTAKEKHWK